MKALNYELLQKF